MALVARSAEGLRALLGIVQRHCRDLGMALSYPKCMVLSSYKDVWEMFDGGEVVGCLHKVIQCKYLGVETCLSPSRGALAMRRRALSLASRYKATCLRVARDGPDIVDLAMTLWCNVALPSILFGCECVPFTVSAIEEINRHQTSVGKFALGLPGCAPNVSSAAILGVRSFQQELYSRQLKFMVRLMGQSSDRWSKDAYLDHLLGGWPSPYIRYMARVRDEVGMLRWPSSVKHVDIVIEHHFLSRTNKELRRLELPALQSVPKRARLAYVNESTASKVWWSTCTLTCPSTCTCTFSCTCTWACNSDNTHDDTRACT